MKKKAAIEINLPIKSGAICAVAHWKRGAINKFYY